MDYLDLNQDAIWPWDYPADAECVIFQNLTTYFDWHAVSLVCRRWASLFPRYADPSQYNNAAIRWAVGDNKAVVVAKLLQHNRVDPNAADGECLHTACDHGLVDIVALLLADPRIDPRVRNDRCIQVAAGFGHQDVVSCLLDDGRIDPTANNNIALFLARKNCHSRVQYCLLQDTRVVRYISRGRVTSY